MSQDTNLLDLENCMAIKLWFTSLAIHRIRKKSNLSDDSGKTNFYKSIKCDEFANESSWILHKSLTELINYKQIENNNRQLSLIELKNALHLIDKNVSETIMQELLRLHSAITEDEKKTRNSSFQISTLALEFLKTNLWYKPALVQWTIDQLLCIWCSSFSNTDSALQNIYINVINEILTNSTNLITSNDIQSLYLQKNINFIDEQYLPTLLCILSKFNITELKEQEFDNWLCSKVLKVCRFKDVELALISRKDKKYFNIWHTFLDKILARNKSPDSFDNAIKIGSAIFEIYQDSPIFLNTNELFIRMLKYKTHWLSDIIEVAYMLIINDQLNDLTKILENTIFNSLWLPLLLKVLADCPNVEMDGSDQSSERFLSISTLLKFLLKSCKLDYWHDTTMSQLKNIIENHLNVLDWIIKSKNLLIEDDKLSVSIKQNWSIKQILQHLQLSSVLSGLKTFVMDIHDRPYEEISTLLPHADESKTIYQAYYIMLSAMKAILLCGTYNLEYIAVTDCFSEMEKYLNSFYPLNLRLEVIENIFSMIFLRHEDFLVVDNISDGGEDDDNTDGKYLSLPKKCSLQHQIGFICNKYAIRETLHYLSRCISVTNNDFSKQRTDSNDSENIKELVQRMTTMQKFLTEASWRLQLLTDSKFLENQGIPDSNSNSFSVTNKLKTIIVYPHIKSNLYKINEYSSDEVDLRSDVDVSSESSSINIAIQQNSKRRRRLRNNYSVDELLNKKESKQMKEFTLDYMLASKESLILRCLWKDDYVEAQRIIEMFNMDNSPLAGEIMFSRAMRTFRDDVTKQLTLTTQQYSDMDQSKFDTKHSTLDFIRKAARDGIQASRITNQVETFLATQESNISIYSNSNNAKEIMNLTAIDLALTIGHSSRISENLAEITMKHLKASRKLENTSVYEFFETIYQLYYEEKGISITKILCDAQISLSLKEQKICNEYWSNLTRILKKFGTKSKLIDIISDEYDHEKIKNQIQKILSICDTSESYLHRLNAHIELLRSIAPQFNEMMKIDMEHSLLENPLHFYIGYRIFHLNEDLEVLETITNQLQFNFVYGILANCCPEISCCEKIDENENNFGNMDGQWGTVCMNKYESITNEFINVNLHDPNQCVVEILTELLQIMGDLNSLSSVIWKIDEANSRDEINCLKKILKKTECLIKLDLSHLSFGNHTLAFFLNIWNLMMLHAMIQVWSHNPPLNELQHSIALTTLGYEIGDLGFVTLFTLRKKLLGQTLCNMGILDFENTEELNEPAWQDLDLQQDSRVIFAMINEYQATPIINIYHSDTLNNELQVAANNYLTHYINHQNQTVLCLPQLIKKYNDFSTNAESTKKCLEEFLNEDWSIEYEAFQYAYDVELKYVKEKSIVINSVAQTKQDNDNITYGMSRIMKPNLLEYLENHCWLLFYLVQRIHENNPVLSRSDRVNIDRTVMLENLLNSQWAQNLKCLFDDNPTIGGLWKYVSIHKLWHQFDVNLKNGDFQNCLTIIDSLPDTLLMTNVEIQNLRDRILSHLINDQLNSDSNKILQYLFQVKNVQMLAQIILANVKVWPVGICENALHHVLNHENKNNLPAHCFAHMNEILCRVMVFDKILPYCNIVDTTDEMNWYNIVYRTEKTDPICIVKSLIDTNQHELCLKWLEYQTVSSEIQSLVSRNLFIGLLKNEKDNFLHARKLLQALPATLSIKLCQGVIQKLESVDALKFTVKYLLENCPTDHEKYRQCSLGVEILDQLNSHDRSSYINLINNPLLMLEQLLMNGKFDSLQRIMKNYSENLKFADIPIGDFDELVLFYAKKSLDSRVVTPRDMGDGAKSRDTSLNDNEEFIMPVTTPTRDEWMPDDKTRECSCCKIVTFSMFNRRHHCRRCGRVVCASCSSQRMRVFGYAESVLVRVCNDCKRQTALHTEGTLSISSSETLDYWRLTNDESHNNTLRDEFCFEYAPNIPLCLAILNLHSDHNTYANFLLDRCDEMKKLLSPDNNGQINPEIDHSMIINMIRSLLVAAKVKCAKLGLNRGLTDCDRFLSQVDLIATLVQSGCFALIPRDDLNNHTLRRLRDSLTEKEQWILALDLSTKSGLETQGVWAAWGKACLKVGYYEGAREKFAHCLEKVHYNDFDDWIILSHPSNTNEQANIEQGMGKIDSKLKETLKNRPSKDPPLLIEILQILEVSNATDENIPQLTRSTATAQEIFNTLNSLTAISQGHYTISKLDCNTRNFRYRESLYYLLMYGSFNSILEFFVRYGEFNKYLCYILDNDIDPELFFNVIFLGCLKNGTMENLFTAMKSKDSSLLIWKKYLICTCHNLEKKQFLHTLYQLQLFMHDYIRAAMTCIRFYVMDAGNYVDICSRSHFLYDAQKHLEMELQMKSFSKRKRKTSSATMSGLNSFIMEMEPSEIDRHINTISRQMEIAKFLGACEKEGRSVNEFLSKLSFMDSEGLQPRTVPTLFGNQQERTHLAVLAILCGRNVEEGFGIAFRVMQDYNLRPQKVYFLVGHILALDKKINSIEQLIKCCRSSGASNSIAISDRVLAHCVKFLLDHTRSETSEGPRDQINSLIRIISDVELKIESYIESKQLKAAYLLAVQHSRAQDVRSILKEADRLGQPAIKSICVKWLQQTQQN